MGYRGADTGLCLSPYKRECSHLMGGPKEEHRLTALHIAHEVDPRRYRSRESRSLLMDFLCFFRIWLCIDAVNSADA
jgi:hypothetical protein